MNLSPKYLIEVCQVYSFIFKWPKGSHQLYYNPVTNKTVIVTVCGGKDVKKGTFLAIIKQAGLDKNDLL